MKMINNNLEHTPLFSVIVPVYNVEEYVSVCLESLAKQTFKRIEVIIVDDGSTDNSLSICNLFAEKYDFFHVFHKNNEGQGIARNFGLSKALGNYISYVDSDDWVDENLFNDIYTTLIDNPDVDFINFGLDFVSSEGKSLYKLNDWSQKYLEGDDIFTNAMLDREVLSSPCNKIYKKCFLLENEIYFPHIKINEDLLYSRIVAYHSSKTLFLDNVYYHALIRSNSTSRAMSINNFQGSIEALRYQYDFLVSKSAYERYSELYKAYFVKQLSYLTILYSFRAPDKISFMNSQELIRNTKYNEYVRNRNVVKLLSRKHQVIAFLCNYPKLLRIAATIVSKIGLYKLGR
ncbi:glycosyltransferase [Limnobaculum zhutongyuii]|uniref:Glycosyltransferase n=1 Tax=Limnobaculum zhutongyuii TaxID=2498113 RepID=A0A411WNV7_9GAMM|nr:glycosyltransferase [Limnobaculum zhutongyuii]QBH97933.1 glycosyltransferase [Limnobaculum zhutongyuii]TQS88208.1 glycosyltransferase [Limnobaculum zhutongyuii]